MEKLNIGCGYKKREGFINIDISEKVKPDIVVNIEKGLPFNSNTFDYIYSSNALEEIRPEFWEFVLSEISRVGKNGCVLELVLSFDNIYQRTRTNHYRTFSWDSFFVFEEGQLINYTAPITLKNIKKRPNILIRFFFNIFPFFKQSVYFKFKIVKNDKRNL